MARYQITAPDGNRYEVTAPDDATEAQVMAYAQQNYKPKEEVKAGNDLGPARGTSVQTGQPLSEGEMLRGGEGITFADTEVVGRPILEYGGLTAGGAVGTASAGPVGGVALGGAGYATGKKIADTIYGGEGRETPTQDVLQTGKDVLTGATMEAGGQVIGKALSVSGNYIAKKIADRFSPTTKAANQLKAATSHGDIYAQNMDEAAALEKEIPGLKFTRGQAANDPALMKLERSKASTSGDAASMLNELKTKNVAAIENYIAKNFGGNADAAFNQIDSVRKSVSGAADTAKSALTSEVSRIGRGDLQESGTAVRDMLKGSRESAKSKASALYDVIPENIPLKPQQLSSTIKSMAGEFKKSGDAGKDFPRGIIGQIKDIISPEQAVSFLVDSSGRQIKISSGLKDIDFTTLRGIRTQIREAIQDATRGASPNYKLARRLGKLSEAVEGTLDQLSKRGDAVGEAYREANKFYAKEYAPTFRKGVVGEILQPGKAVEGYKLSDAEVLSQVFKPGPKGLGAADQFIKATGGEGNAAIKDYAEQRLLQEGTNKLTGELTKEGLARFRSKYAGVLKKFGIEKQYADLALARQNLTKVVENQAAFEKSTAAAFLKTDPETAIGNALAGSGSQVQKVNDLVNIVKSDKAAIQGLKRAFVDHVIGKIQPTAADPLKKGFMKYSPAMKELFKDEPGKLAALNRVRSAYEIMNRTGRGTTGGSDTAEKLSSLMTTLAGGKTAGVIRFLAGPFRKATDDQAEKLLTQALYDPDLAYALMATSQGRKGFDGKIASAITKLAAQTTKDNIK